MKKHLLTLILCLIGCFTAFAQNSNKPVTWKYTVTQTSATEATLKFTATIAKDWHLFAIKHGDGFEIPTTIEFAPSPKYELKGKPQEPARSGTIPERERFGTASQRRPPERRCSSRTFRYGYLVTT